MPRRIPSKATSRDKTVYTSTLAIHALKVSVSLGAGSSERGKKQDIIIDVRLYLPSLLSSATSDTGEYICYHGLSEKIYALCTAKPYRLIEFLTMEIYRLLRKEIPKHSRIWIRLTKPRILLSYVSGGTSFTYSDLPPHASVVP